MGEDSDSIAPGVDQSGAMAGAALVTTPAQAGLPDSLGTGDPNTDPTVGGPAAEALSGAAGFANPGSAAAATDNYPYLTELSASGWAATLQTWGDNQAQSGGGAQPNRFSANAGLAWEVTKEAVKKDALWIGIGAVVTIWAGFKFLNAAARG